MNSKMKVFVGTLVAAISLGAANSAMATRLTVSGIPAGIMANSPLSSWQDQFTLLGASVGSCPGNSTGVYVTMNRPGTAGAPDPTADRIWQLVLAAEMAQKPLSVLLDDSQKDSTGRCIAIWVSM